MAGWGAAGDGRYADTLRHGQAAITLAEKGAPQHLWLAVNVAWAGALALGPKDLLQSCTIRIVDSARAAKDDYAVSRAIWTQVLVHRSIPLGVDVRAAAAECLELAQRVGNPTLLARAHAVVGIVQCPDNPAAAGEHFAACEQLARLVNARIFIVYGVLWGAVAASMQNPDAGLRELARALDFHQATATPLGAIRVALRDMLPALAAVGLHRLVVMLDTHLPTVAIIQPEGDAAAVQSARHALGAAETDQAQAQAQAIDFDELLSLLRQELETVTRTRTTLPEQRPQPPINH